jgi:hypothetical protein
VRFFFVCQDKGNKEYSLMDINKRMKQWAGVRTDESTETYSTTGKNIPLGQYSYLFEGRPQQRIDEDAERGYFFKSVYKALVLELSKRAKKYGYTLDDDIYSASIRNATFMFISSGGGTKGDWEANLVVGPRGGEEQDVTIVITQGGRQVAKTSEFVTGNIRRDIDYIAKEILETARKKVK